MRCTRIYSLGLLVGLQCFCSLCAFGQEGERKFPIAEISFGYSYLHTDTKWLDTNTLAQQCASANGGTCPFTLVVHPGFNGWYLAPQINFRHWYGIKMQISGQYGRVVHAKSNSTSASLSFPQLHAYDVLFGGVVSRRARRYTLFAHGLIGLENFGLASSQVNGSSLSFYPSNSTSDTAFDFGGGVDLKLWKFLAVRAGQLDYQFVNTENYSHLSDWRYSGGMVIILGGK